MPLVEVGRLDAGGIVEDQHDVNLPLKVFTDGEDVSFTTEGVRPMVKEVGVLQGVVDNPLYVEAVPIGASSLAWIYLTATKAYSVINGVHSEITRIAADGGDYSALETFGWNGGFFHGIPIYNDGFDVPQQWDPSNPENPLINLENWPSSIRAVVLRPFRNFLIGLGLSQSSGIFDRQVVFWSNAADPGTVPPDWNFLDPASRAGIRTLSETSDRIVDGLAGRDEFFVYKENSIWAMRLIGGSFTFQFSLRFSEVGILTTDCVCSFNNRHFVVSNNDFYVHDGITIEPVGHGKTKAKFFRDLNAAQKAVTFVVHNEQDKTIWICYPTGNSQWCNKALIWDYIQNTWTYRNLPSVSSIAKGPLTLEEDSPWDQFGFQWGGEFEDRWTAITTTWAIDNNNWSLDGDDGQWDLDRTLWDAVQSWDVDGAALQWDQEVFIPVSRALVMSSYIERSLVTYDPATDTSTDGTITWKGSSSYPPFWMVPAYGVHLTGRVQRLGMAVIGQDQTGAPTVNKAVRKVFKEIWPEVPQGELQVRIGWQDTISGPVTWEAYQTFNGETDIKLNVFAAGKFMAIEFKGVQEAEEAWILAGYAFEVSVAGRY